jgi:hypothetical protein
MELSVLQGKVLWLLPWSGSVNDTLSKQQLAS